LREGERQQHGDGAGGGVWWRVVVAGMSWWRRSRVEPRLG